MDKHSYPVGLAFEVDYPEFTARLTVVAPHQLEFRIDDGPFARTEIVSFAVAPLKNGVFVVSWQEHDRATVINIQNFDSGVILSFATRADGSFLRLTGTIRDLHGTPEPIDHRPKSNKALVRDAMIALFQRHDPTAVKRFYAKDYVQHNPNIPAGRDALEAIVASLPPDVFYEPGMIVADKDLVAIHGRIVGWSETPQIVVDIFRVARGRLAEHWDVLQTEVAKGIAGRPMFESSESERD